jgi:predicted house-cleaning noncanonical NTP pyrophosphatase (MazG superfamily)
MKHNKLVRDKIPAIIEANGEKAVTRILDDADYLSELEKKLQEECAEVLAERGDHRIEELADVLEVVKALAEAQGSDMAAIEQARKTKAEKRGGFAQKIFLIETK